jgi:uncharacterized protein
MGLLGAKSGWCNQLKVWVTPLINGKKWGVMCLITPEQMAKAVCMLGILILLATGAGGLEATEKPSPPSIRTLGEATVAVKPDQAQIDIGIVTQAESAQSAAQDNAQKLEMVLTELRKLLGPQADLKTISYALSPLFHYPQPGGTPTITGYSATNIVRVTTTDLTQVGKIIDVTSQSSASKIERLHFTLKDEQAAYAQALRDAVARATSKAEAIASALGAKIVRVLAAEEAGLPPRPIMPVALEARAGPALAETPVAPGTLEIRATVTLTVEIAQ